MLMVFNLKVLLAFESKTISQIFWSFPVWDPFKFLAISKWNFLKTRKGENRIFRYKDQFWIIFQIDNFKIWKSLEVIVDQRLVSSFNSVLLHITSVLVYSILKQSCILLSERSIDIKLIRVPSNCGILSIWLEDKSRWALSIGILTPDKVLNI